jgi:hypothetical protein
MVARIQTLVFTQILNVSSKYIEDFLVFLVLHQPVRKHWENIV